MNICHVYYITYVLYAISFPICNIYKYISFEIYISFSKAFKRGRVGLSRQLLCTLFCFLKKTTIYRHAVREFVILYIYNLSLAM